MSKIPYNHKAIEKKWRENWEKNPVNVKENADGSKREKYYCLDMFPYPSGNGLHVGPVSYTHLTLPTILRV